MSIELGPPRPRKKPVPPSPASPCVACSIPTATGSDVEGIGRVGPECRRKVAALEQVLEREGLQGLWRAGVVCEVAREVDEVGDAWWVLSEPVRTLGRRAEALGLRATWEWRVYGETALARIGLPEGKAARKRLFKQACRLSAAGASA